MPVLCHKQASLTDYGASPVHCVTLGTHFKTCSSLILSEENKLNTEILRRLEIENDGFERIPGGTKC